MFDSDQLVSLLSDQLDASRDEETLFIGIQSSGVYVQDCIFEALNISSPKYSIGVGFHRDDFGIRGLAGNKQGAQMPPDVASKHIVLIDDVIQSGRTARAAINVLFDYGRPASIRLAVLIDRGGRELPIEPQFCASRTDVDKHKRIEISPTAVGGLAINVA
jgi:pyrimidine operon attenuation protein/uracil phosphoribosyltransferase